MYACGFNSKVTTIDASELGGFYSAEIKFPDRLTDARNGHISRSLHVKAIDTAVASNTSKVEMRTETFSFDSASRSQCNRIPRQSIRRV
jgi:hypothetical protein